MSRKKKNHIPTRETVNFTIDTFERHVSLATCGDLVVIALVREHAPLFFYFHENVSREGKKNMAEGRESRVGVVRIVSCAQVAIMFQALHRTR